MLKSPKSKKNRKVCNDESLIKGILLLIVEGNAVLKARAYLFIYFLLNHDFNNIKYIPETKLMHLIERRGRETAKFESQALQFVAATLHDHFPQLIKMCT